jgi:S-adenosylmethionine decarboxylase
MKRKVRTYAKAYDCSEIFLDKFINSDSKISFNVHTNLSADLLGCDPIKLQDEKFVTSTILSSILQGRMKLLDLRIKKFEGGGRGITAVALISDSHIIVNTFPETTSLFLDVYACTGAPINVLYEFIRRFQPKKVDFVVLPRTVKDETMQSRVILGEEDVKDEKLKEWMKKRELIPLINTSEQFITLANFIGFVFGDGHLHKDLNYVGLWQKNRYVLEVMKEKLEKIGVKATIRPRISKAGKKVFELSVNDKNFCKLLFLLGAPKGSKVKQKLKLPWWLKEDEYPIVGAFLSSFLLSELSKPKSKYMKTRSTLTPYITFTLMSDEENKVEMKKFLKGVKKLLKSFYVTSNDIKIRKIGDKLRFELEIKASKENLMRLQALISLTKIFPMGIFTPALSLNKMPPLYNKNSKFYKIIDYLLEHRSSYSRKLFKEINISRQNGYKWIKALNHSNIIKRKREGRKVIIRLNLRSMEKDS